MPTGGSGVDADAGTTAETVVRLEGARASVTGRLRSVDDDRADRAGHLIRIPLTAERWGRPGLALPSGDYRLQLVLPGASPSSRITASSAIAKAAPLRLEHALENLEVAPIDGGLRVRVTPPLAADERGRDAQRRLQTEYFRAIFRPDDAVFFESFYARTVACNPAGIDRALSRLRPETTRYWSVADASVPVPDGAVRVIEGSRAWWRARGSARVLVVNDWLRKRFLRRRHQRVLQTWHGTMLKRLALDRPGTGLRTRLAVRRERDRWDVMLAQNDYAAGVFRRAYAFDGPVWELGYPRNDVLVDGDAAEIRRRVGIPVGARVVLYAPTWRDDRTEIVDYLDLSSFAEQLPDDTVLLVRGHSRTLPYGRDLRGDRLIDVTTYPDVAELLLVADILVTDYSSVMFDFAATGRPIVYFTPDLAHYSEDLRGFYFDLLAEAPGPVVQTRDELLGLLSGDARADEFAEQRARWRARYAPDDDGHAGERVVQRMLDEGMLG
ncbi:glycosyl/glycerophosphate transferase [Schumannella luteola]|nr:glycosyl/glycerophosphate transferase [Schumannella luteola]